MSKRNKSFFKVLFYSSFFTIILIVIFALLSFSFIKTFIREREIRKRIVTLEQEIKKLEGERTNFLEAIEYFKTDFFKEKEAREKFGLKKEGEKTIIILPPEEVEEKEEEDTNPQKWWEFLFK